MSDDFNEFNEGYVDYLFGRKLHHNPYTAYGDEELDDPRYYMWYDGWNKAQRDYPDLENLDE